MAERRERHLDQVEEVRTRIEHWRRTRPKRTAMPEELWNEAATLAGVQGIYRISRALGVNYESLRRRVERETRGGSGSGQHLGGFFELSMAELVPSSSTAGAVVELSGVDGAKVMVQLPCGDGVDVLGLAEAFWRRRT